jgi:hypothetical protein
MEMPWRHTEPEKGDEEKAAVRTFFASLPSCQRQEPDNFEWLVDERDLGAVVVQYANAAYSAVAVKRIEVVMDTLDPEKAVSAMLDRIELAAARLDDYQDKPGFNERVGAPLSGPHLHGLNRLLLLENCCTDELQTALDKGWRIIAVCPQEARRPDYVLGSRADGGEFRTAARSAD